MEESQVIRNDVNRRLLSNQLCHEDQRENASGLAEANVLIELARMLEKKGQNIREGKIAIGADYKCAHQKIKREIKTMSILRSQELKLQ